MPKKPEEKTSTEEGDEAGENPERRIDVHHIFEFPEKEKKKETGTPPPTDPPEGDKGGDSKNPEDKIGKTGEGEGDKSPKKPDKPTKTPQKKEPTAEELIAELAKEKKAREDAEASRDEFSSIIEAEAVKAFEADKGSFLNAIKDEEKRKIVSEKIGDDPEILDQYKRMAELLTWSIEAVGGKVTGKEGTKEGEGTKPPEPKEGEGDEDGDEGGDEGGEGGSVRAPPAPSGVPAPPTGAGAGNWKEYVDGLYSIMLDPAKSPAEKKEADRMVNELFLQFIKGFRAGDGKAQISIAQCPQCGALLTARGATACEICGWKHMRPELRGK